MIPPFQLSIISSTYHRRATFIGVLKQEVNRSAGSSGFIGRSWFAPHDANWMQFFTARGTGMGLPCDRQRWNDTESFLTEINNFQVSCLFSFL